MDHNLQKLYEQRLFEEGRRNRYYSMFKGESSDEVERIVKQAITWFKREDRIIWYLRLYKLVLINNEDRLYKTHNGFADLFTDEEQRQYEKNLEWRDKFIQYTIKHSNIFDFSPEEVEKYYKNFSGSKINSIESELRHYLSLPIEKIHNFRFEWQWWPEILNHFNEFEREWQIEQRESDEWIDITDELKENYIEVIHRFDDGFAWLDLKRRYCEKEGDAMGHCGNTANPREGDTVLSLRKIKKKGDKVLSRPSLTFILQDKPWGKSLGEMKGRENNKPHEKYHPHIITLLKMKKNGSFLIDDLHGGGYLPESNFSLEDLSEEFKENLYKTRPDLKPLTDVYKEQGMIPEIEKKITSVDDYVGKTDGGDYLYGEFRNMGDLFDSFPHERGDNFKLKQYLPYITDDEWFQADHYYEDSMLEELYKETLYEDKSNSIINAVYAYMIDEYGEEELDEYHENLNPYEKDSNVFGNQFDFLNEKDDQIIDMLKNAHADGQRSGTEGEMFNAFRDGLDSLVVQRPDGFVLYLHFTDAYGDGKIHYVCSEKEAVELYTEMKKQGYSDVAEFMNMEYEDSYDRSELHGDMDEPYYGFNGHDESYAKERFKELLDEEGILNYGNNQQLGESSKYLKYF